MCLFLGSNTVAAAGVTTNLVEGVHAALFRRMRRQLSSHVGGRGTPLHAELVKDFFVMIMNLSFNNIDAFVGFLQLIRYDRCCLLCVSLLLNVCPAGTTTALLMPLHKSLTRSAGKAAL